jgi:hypothetical protein
MIKIKNLADSMPKDMILMMEIVEAIYTDEMDRYMDI